MEEIVVTATRRDVIGKQVKALRREGKLPAVIYGHRLEPLAITLELRETSRSLTGLAPSTFVTVVVDGEKHVTLVREKQRDKISGILQHVDFLAISMEEKLRTNVYLNLVGDPPAIAEYNAILVTGTEVLEVECFPQDLPESIEVDLSGLTEIGNAIYVRDLEFSDKLRILDDPDTMIALTSAPEAVEEEEEEVEEELEEEGVSEPEVIEKGRKEEEEF